MAVHNIIWMLICILMILVLRAKSEISLSKVTKFSKLELNSIIHADIIKIMQTRSQAECGKECANKDFCSFYQYTSDINQCSLIKLNSTGFLSFVANEQKKIYIKVHELAGCSTSPCLNFGTCLPDEVSYTCVCETGFTGPNCETNIDDCSRDPCLNNGTCEDGVDSYTCICAPGLTGPTCGDCLHSWTPPSNWPAGDEPVYYHGFENTCGLVNNGAELQDGLVGKSLEALEPNWVEFESDVLVACMVRPGTCTNGGSVSIWIKSIVCTQNGGIISSFMSSSTAFYIMCNSLSEIRVTVTNSNGGYDTHFPFDPGWIHVVLTYNATDGIIVYQNGIMENSEDETTGSSFTGESNVLAINRFCPSQNERYTDVEVDELSFWNRELTASEVLILYQQYENNV